MENRRQVQGVFTVPLSPESLFGVIINNCYSSGTVYSYGTVPIPYHLNSIGTVPEPTQLSEG